MQKSNRRTTISRRDTMRRLLGAAASLAGAAVTNPFGGGAAAAAALPYAGATFPEKSLVNETQDLLTQDLVTQDLVTQDLAKLAAGHFEQLVGESFTVGQYQVTLRQVRRRQHKSGARFREQFALVFKGPQALPIGSEVLPVTHPAIGQHGLLVTQTVGEINGTALEICFS
ncbi:MAG TPA: hypothetical protein VMR17_17805 [Xanthobacteraceae bacterium]|nr:hypothetical protein [Xanthobacteraceae bacterium]